jgi:hypothetical protein
MKFVTCVLASVIILLIAGHFILMTYMENTDRGPTTASVMFYYEQIFGDTPDVTCDWQPATQAEAQRCVQIPAECVSFPTTSWANSFSSVAFRETRPKVNADWLNRGLCWPEGGAWLPSVTNATAYGRSLRLGRSCEPYQEWKAAARQYEPSWIEQRKSDIPAYYINSKKNKDRDAKMRQVLKRVANTFQRIEGRDIYEPGFGKNFSHLAFRETALSSLKIAEMKAVAILLSHREAIRTALSNGDEMALVFEDDVSMELAPMWIDTIDAFAAALPAQWMAAQLGYTRFATGVADALVSSATPLYYRRIYQRAQQGAENGAFAYLIHRRGMERVLSYTLEEVKQRCSYFTADDCLLGFTRTEVLASAGPMAKRIYLATPPFFTTDMGATSTHLEGLDAKRATFAGYCVAVHANAAAERYVCTDQKAGSQSLSPPMRLPMKSEAEGASTAWCIEGASTAWCIDGCAAEYYLDANADELVPLFTKPSFCTRLLDSWCGLPHVPLAADIAYELEQHYVGRGKASGMKCSPCPAGQRLQKALRSWWMGDEDPDARSLAPVAVGPISAWPTTPRWPHKTT